jgi:hypothetical protein
MDTLRRISPWLSRVLLGLVTFVLLMISVRFFTDPDHAVAPAGFSLESGLARTNARVIGVFPLSCAVITLACLLSAARLRSGLAFVATVMGLALAARVYGILADGTGHESLRLTVVEVVVMLVAVGNLLVQSSGRDRDAVTVADTAAGPLPIPLTSPRTQTRST